MQFPTVAVILVIGFSAIPAKADRKKIILPLNAGLLISPVIDQLHWNFN